ncbi:MAG TPA: DUF6325 family protein [Microbacteriaceae bacterium]|nr:DUF6325 family protein [Microbacteriaceae bacterium]
MVSFKFGPVELYLVALEGDRPAPGVVDALVELIEAGTVRLLDLVIVTRGEDGSLSVLEVEADEFGFEGIELHAPGLTGADDADDLAELLEPGASAVVIALELLWAKRLAEQVAASGAEVLSVERIPAPVVNALVDALADES